MKKPYSKKIITTEELQQLQSDFFAKADPTLKLLCELAEDFPSIAVTVKNAEGRILYTNPYNARISGWQSPADQLGYTSWELYPPDQAAVYGGRDREVMETGVPIVKRLYGFVADRSSAMNCVTIRPVMDRNGEKRIGTITVYHRAKETMASSHWYDPIKESIAFLNDHLSDNHSVAELAKRAHYSENQYRRRFRELMKTTPSKYLAATRVNLAKTLLVTTSSSIADIAQRCGFYDHAHFIRTFKSLVGVTPAKYRAAP